MGGPEASFGSSRAGLFIEPPPGSRGSSRTSVFSPSNESKAPEPEPPKNDQPNAKAPKNNPKKAPSKDKGKGKGKGAKQK